MKTKALFLCFTLFIISSLKAQAASVCGMEIPGTYHQSGHDPSFEIEVFKKMPHFQYYLRSKSHPLSLIVGEKVLTPKVVQSLNRLTIDSWAHKELQSTVNIYSQTKFEKKSVDAFLSEVAGHITTLSYNNQYEQRLLVIKSLDCAIEFIAIGPKSQSQLVKRTISNFLITLKGNKENFLTIPNSYWYTDLGPANQIAITILLIMIAISIGLIFYVRKKNL